MEGREGCLARMALYPEAPWKGEKGAWPGMALYPVAQGRARRVLGQRWLYTLKPMEGREGCLARDGLIP